MNRLHVMSCRDLGWPDGSLQLDFAIAADSLLQCLTASPRHTGSGHMNFLVPFLSLPADHACRAAPAAVPSCNLAMFLQVSNAAGYLCHIQLNCRLDVAPEVVFEIFSHPDNAGAFRDIKKVGYRKVSTGMPCHTA